MDKNIGDFLRRKRANKGLSQEQIARIIGVSRNTVAQWERGENEPGAMNFLRISNVLDVDMRELQRLFFSGKEHSDEKENLVREGIENRLSMIERKLERIESKEKARPKVLVVEDEYRAYQVISEIIDHNTEYICRRAHDATEALIELETKNSISIIILDLLLPDIDGVELLKKIKAHDTWAKIPVIVVSGTEKKKIEEARACGVFSVIEKPIRFLELVEAVNMINPAWYSQSAFVEV